MLKWNVCVYDCYIAGKSYFTGLKILLIMLLALIANNVTSQNKVDNSDGIIEKIFPSKDTLAPYNPSNDVLDKLSQPLDSILLKNSNTKFKKELYNLIFKEEDNNEDTTKKRPVEPTKLTISDGKVIRNIRFFNVNIFSPAVDDTNYSSTSWFQRTVNKNYKDTRENVLAKFLMFEPGDTLDVFLLAENERVLRDISYIQDARFIVKKVEGTVDSVDILLLTQDRFPIGFEADIEKSSIVSFGLSHHNLLGYGQKLSVLGLWDKKNVPHLGYRLSYGTSNLAGSFISVRIDYTHKWNQETYLFEVSRNFRVINFRNAGGVLFESTYIQKNVELLDTTIEDVVLKYTNSDLWAGRILKIFYNSSKMRTGLFAAGRLNKYLNFDEPFIDDQYKPLFQNRTLLLFSSGITHHGFRKDNMIYTYGRIEDVPFGYLLDFTSGYEWSDEKMRLYTSFGVAYGNYLKNTSYIYGQIKYGTFLYKKYAEQSAFRLYLQYFSKLYRYNNFKYRNFISFTYLKGLNRYTGEYATLANQSGIPGLASVSMKGTDKIVLNLESVLFSPYSILGFRAAFFSSLDLGVIKRENTKFNDSRLFSGLSFGVRLRNDKLVFDTFVIRLSIFPGKPGDAVAQNLIIENLDRVKFNDFFPYKPAIVNYQ